MSSLPAPRDLFAELRRRRVFHAAAVYGAIAWMVVQIAATVFPYVGLPARGVTTVIYLALLGFPIAMVVAWAYDLTPDGMRRTDAVAGAPGELVSLPMPTAKLLGAGALIGALAVGGLLFTYRMVNPVAPGARGGEPVRSIAVLPFTNVSADEENEYFSDGLTEELMNALAQVEGLRVAARTSAFAFKGVPHVVGEIGRQLNVETVLEGSVRKAGNRLRIQAQLINVSDGHQLWSQTYDRELADVFVIQDEISRAIVANLLPRLVGSAALERLGSTTNVEAYELYLKGRHAFWEGQTEENLGQAAAYYEQAIAKDPGYALAYAGLSDAYMLLANHASPREYMPQGKEAALRALELDPQLAEGYVALASINWFYEWDWEAAERNYRRSFSVNRVVYTRCICYVWYLTVIGDTESAVKEAERARALDPLSHLPVTTLAWMYYLAGQHESAAGQLRALEEMGSTSALIPRLAAWMHWDGGRLAQAVATFETQLREGETPAAFAGRAAPVVVAELAYMYANTGSRADALLMARVLASRAELRYVAPENVAAAYAAAGEIREATLWLERALENRSNLGMFSAYPIARVFAYVPRYHEVLREIGVPAPVSPRPRITREARVGELALETALAGPMQRLLPPGFQLSLE